MDNGLPPKGDILIVDDIPENLYLLSEMLEAQGYDVRSVKNGSAALMGVRAQPPDLILLDITMPEMDGYTVCQQLKAEPTQQEIPVIFISGLHEVLDKVKAFAVGGVDYITKPFQVEEVLARVEHQLTIRRLQAKLVSAWEQERQLNQRIEAMATLEERNRIARDIHDSLGHALVALNIQMESALALWQHDAERAYACLQEAKQLGSEALQAVRSSVSDLRSHPFQGQSLEAAIAALLKDFYHATHIWPDCSLELPASLSLPLKTVIYRLVQEGLTNICKHAAATTVQLRIQSQTDQLLVTLQDNGKGFQKRNNPSGFGLQGMQERVIALGGQLTIDSQPQAGCRIVASFPMA